MEFNKIYNEDCFITMGKMPFASVSNILTSPFYNTNKKQCKSNTLKSTKKSQDKFPYLRYDVHVDNMTDDEYCEFTKNLFWEFDRVLYCDGTILYNISYGNNNRDGMFKAINTIISETPFTIADVITWKKSSAMPNNCSPNKLTRITEFVFVFCRKDEVDSFWCNKPIVNYRSTGQASYGNIFNFIEAKNNDEKCPYNKATYSSDLCKQLLKIYCPKDGVVYDPFMGSGTTAVACKQLGIDYIGSEISENQCKWAEDRLRNNPIMK